MKGLPEFPSEVAGSGDVLSHLCKCEIWGQLRTKKDPLKNFDVLYLMYFLDTSVDIKYNNKDVHVSLIPNPSHLEVSNASFIQPYRKELQA